MLPALSPGSPEPGDLCIYYWYMTDQCLLINKLGRVCGKKIYQTASTCKEHVGFVPCPHLINGQACGVALPQQWRGLGLVLKKHPHHGHISIRSRVVIPESGRCLSCRAYATRDGYCDVHHPGIGQTRRELAIAVIEKNMGKKMEDEFRNDRKELVQVIEAVHNANEFMGHIKQGPFDVTDYAPISNPYVELYRLAGQILAWKDALAAEVAKQWEIGYEGKTGEQIKAEVQVFQDALDKSQQILVAISKLSLEEKMLRVAEREAQLMTRALERTLDSLGLPAGVVEQARVDIAERLRTPV